MITDTEENYGYSKEQIDRNISGAVRKNPIFCHVCWFLFMTGPGYSSAKIQWGLTLKFFTVNPSRTITRHTYHMGEGDPKKGEVMLLRAHKLLLSSTISQLWQLTQVLESNDCCGGICLFYSLFAPRYGMALPWPRPLGEFLQCYLYYAQG